MITKRLPKISPAFFRVNSVRNSPENKEGLIKPAIRKPREIKNVLNQNTAIATLLSAVKLSYCEPRLLQMKRIAPLLVLFEAFIDKEKTQSGGQHAAEQDRGHISRKRQF